MQIFGKKTKNKPLEPVSSEGTFDFKPSFEAHQRGIISLASMYYTALPLNEKFKLANIFAEATGESQEGKTILMAVEACNAQQLFRVQKLIEEDYKITKH